MWNLSPVQQFVPGYRCLTGLCTAWVTAAASSWNEVLMVLFFLFMQASLSAQVSWNLMLHLLGAACAVGSSGFTLSTLGRTGQAALAGASGRPFLRQDPTHSDPAPQQGHTNSSTFISHLRRASLVPGWWPMCKSRRGVEPERRELCSKGPRLSLGLQRSSSLGCLPLKVRSPWLLAAHRAGSPKAQWAEPSRLHSGFPGMQVGGASHSYPVFSQQL